MSRLLIINLFCSVRHYLQGVLETFLHGIVHLDILRLFEGDGAVNRAGARFEELDLLQVVFVDPPGGVGAQSEPGSVQDPYLQTSSV